MSTLKPTRSNGVRVWMRAAYLMVLLAVGLTLTAGGIVLVAVDGSTYYVLAGLPMASSAILLFRRNTWGAAVYAAMLVGTLAWAVFEAGFDFWALLPRLAMPFVLGIGLLFVSAPTTGRGRGGLALFGVGLAVAIAAGVVVRPAQPTDPIWQTGPAVAAPSRLAQPLAAIDGDEWPSWGNDAGGTRFSPLNQIDTGNVGRLEVAWEADFGSAKRQAGGAMEATPLMVGDTLYLCNASNEVLALDAATGQERWRHDMTTDQPPSAKPCRGVAFHRSPVAGACAERIISPTQTAELVALDAATGEPCAGFGRNGRVDLREGLRDAPIAHYYLSSAPQIVRGRIVVGGPVLDGQIYDGPSGVIRAYDVTTGQLAWAFDAGHPERTGAPHSGEVYTPSTPNSWAPISADEALGLVYLPTGNTNGSDYYGGLRRPHDEAISSSVVALDAETGRLRWSFQTTHHDVWDYDVPSQPTLVDLPTPEGMRRALIQPTKRGEMFVLDRVTGQPLKAVAERAVPQGDIASGEWLSPTQPFSVAMPSFRGPDLAESDMWGMTPIDQMVCRIRFARSRYQGPLTPLTPGRPTIVQPGYGGGSNWGSVSIDIDRGIMIANTNRLPSQMTLITRAEADREGVRVYDGKGPPSEARPQTKTPYAITGGAFLSFTGAPCVRPPYGIISAVDLASGRMIWSKPLGTARDSGPFGMALHLPIEMGVPMVGGSLVTRGGLTFIGATQEHSFRAIDTATGRVLWQARLPGGGNAVPMSYARGGRQFVVIAAPGNGGLKSKRSTKLVAFALPRLES